MDQQARIVQNEVAYRYVSAHTAGMWGMNFLADLEHVEGATHDSTHLKTPELDTTAVIKAYRASSCLSAMSSPISSSNTLSALGRDESVHSGRTLSLSAAQGISPTARSTEIDIPIPNMGSKNSSAGSLASGSAGGGITPSMSQRIYSKKKLFILDYEGTLSQFQPLAEISSPTEKVRSVISAILTASFENVVLLLSGHGRKNLAKWFGDLDLFLAAEDGCFLRPPGDETWIPLYSQPSNRKVNMATTDSLNDLSLFQEKLSAQHITRNGSTSSENGILKKDGSKEKLQVGNGDKNDAAFVSGLYKGSLSSMGSYDGTSSDSDEMVSKWKGNVKQVMEFFAERTPGALVDEGEATLTWHFVDADREFGLSQSRALQKHLELFLVQNLNMNIVSEEGRNRWLKVRPVGIDKADAVYKTIELVRECGGRTNSSEDDDQHDDDDTDGNSRIDFVFCVGDDRADEGMFQLLRDEKQRVDLGISGISNRIFTTRVGSSATASMFAMESHHSVVELLDELVRKTHGNMPIIEEEERKEGTVYPKSAPA